MNKDDRKDAGEQRAREDADAQKRQSAEDIQPPPTGANRGSPAAPVMKEFQKTRNESTGRS